MSLATASRLAGLALLAALAAAPLAVGLLAPDAAERLAAGLRGLGPAGPAILLVVQALVAASGVVPASGVGIAAGALLGPVEGFCVAAMGTMAGALVTFGLARTVLGARALARLGGRRLAALDGALAAEGWRLVCLIRLSPIMPFAPTSLALGASAVSLRDYALGTLAALPALFAYVALGALGRGGGHLLSGAGPAEWLRLGVLGAGALATALLMLRLRRILGRAMPEGAPVPGGTSPGGDIAA
ncbi:TVP38/TMEM64 family protein [Methylobacterium sp. J-076]|uniref:TVP38/TMEM64 family protein n=1 Tax=Methylobacterium sp. J-076 TaxID=2836655 RepID=UPI001FB8FB0B|nr:VTT domain-containing protein [Methylobacterium sp. J-076]MCJ2012583.1 VTT domain-containing protein [Methylobacterium sp. J-076]